MPRFGFNRPNPDYDIPDDPKPEVVEKVYSELEDMVNNLLYKKQMVDHIKELRTEAMQLRVRQNKAWDAYGDNYRLEELVDFILNNREDIVGIVKNANWLVKVNRNNWEYEFSLYYDTLLAFIERSLYVISSYENQIKKINKKIKEMV